jgi:hypothetical protein
VVFILEVPEIKLGHWPVVLIQSAWFSASRWKYRVVLKLVNLLLKCALKYVVYLFIIYWIYKRNFEMTFTMLCAQVTVLWYRCTYCLLPFMSYERFFWVNLLLSHSVGRVLFFWIPPQSYSTLTYQLILFVRDETLFCKPSHVFTFFNHLIQLFACQWICPDLQNYLIIRHAYCLGLYCCPMHVSHCWVIIWYRLVFLWTSQWVTYKKDLK